MEKQKKICVLAPELHDTVSQEIISGILSRSRALAIEVTIVSAGGVNRHDRTKNEEAILYSQVLDIVKFDGLIIMTGSFSNHATADEVKGFFKFIPKDFPVVSLSMELPRFISLVVDNITPIKEIVEHLVDEHNKKRIMFIKGPEGQDEAEDRFKGYLEGLESRGIAVNQELIFTGDFSPPSGSNAIKKIVESGIKLPDAVVCSDDDTALGVYSELKKQGLFDKGVSVTGFDNMEYTKSMDPQLTTVDQSFINQGQQALNILLNIINKCDFKEEQYLPKVIFRESCGCSSLFNIDETSEVPSDNLYSELIYHNIEELQIDGLERHISDITSHIYKFVEDSSYKFTHVLDGYISRYKYKGYSLKIISDIVGQLTRRIINQLKGDHLILYFEQIEEINSNIIKAISQEKVREYRSFNEQSSELDAVLMELATCMTFNELLEAMEKNFFYLGIKRMSLVFPNSKDPMLKNISKKVFEKDDSLNRSRKEYCTLFLPIFYHYDFGYCKVDIVLNSFHIAEVITFQISRALYLITLFNNLNDKIFELEKSYRDLRATKELLLESEQLANLGGLVAGFTHEINSPIGVGVTATSHLIEVIKKLNKDFSSKNIKKSDLEEFINSANESGNIIMSNLNRTASLIQGFKQIAVDQASEVLRTFELGAYLKEVIHSLTPILKPTSHSIDIEINENLYVESYPGAISQIVTNLIQNSLKHGFENMEMGIIKLTAYSKDGSVLIDYRDNGCGIENKNIKNIFESYYSTKIGQGGSGLGLAIIKQLVEEKLGGTIICESDLGKGVLFHINFPKES